MLRSLRLAVALTLVAAAPVAATFPGRNGALLLTHVSSSKYQNQQTTLYRIGPRSGRVRYVPVCTIVDYSPYGHPDKCFGAGPPSVSPDGRSVAMIGQDLDRANQNGMGLAWSVRVISLEDGSQTRTPIVSSPIPVPSYAPIVRWSADASGWLILRSLYPATESDGRQVPGRAVLIGRDGSDGAELASDVQAPDVAADGRLAFTRNGNVYVQAAGQDARRLTWKGGDQPSWSPGGRFVAFTRRGHVHVVPSEGGRARRLSRGRHPVWSPDGRSIAFLREVPAFDDGSSVTHVFTLDRRTGRVRRVTRRYLTIDVSYDLVQPGLDWQPLPPRP
jgi:hypothetical protein